LYCLFTGINWKKIIIAVRKKTALSFKYKFSFLLKPEVLFFYDYFYPGYKAGGPIQSLTNLALSLQSIYMVSVVTSTRDLHSSEPYNDVTLNSWNEVVLPGSPNPINVYYADTNLDKNAYRRIFKEAKPAVVYFNNIYSGLFFRLPLQVLKSLGITPKVVICPRGMLQNGALSVKPLRKKLYLSYLRYSGMLKNAFWHATNHEEFDDINNHFPINRGVVIAPNIPKVPYTIISCLEKKAGGLRLVYLSLITEKKNLLLLLHVIEASESVSLDIYGPITDTVYWQQCEGLINQMPDKVKYKGDVQPVDVQQVLSQYDALILLTKGENFGHALYESLSIGRPIITSHFTPWIELEAKNGGWNVGINKVAECTLLLDKLKALDSDAWKNHCIGALKLAKDYFEGLNTVENYKELFSA
jgi:hypothetical protein